MLEEAIEVLTAMRILGLRSWFITFLTEGYLVLGRIAEALKQAKQAVALARAQKQRGWEAWALKLLGDVHAQAPVGKGQRRPEQAGEAYRQALALATELDMCLLVAHCHFGLAKIYRPTNKHQQAREHFTIATTMYREMDMQFWLEQAEVEMRELS